MQYVYPATQLPRATGCRLTIYPRVFSVYQLLCSWYSCSSVLRTEYFVCFVVQFDSLAGWWATIAVVVVILTHGGYKQEESWCDTAHS